MLQDWERTREQQEERESIKGGTGKTKRKERLEHTGTLVARLLRSPQDIVALVTGLGDGIVLEVELVSVDIALLSPSRESRL